MFPVTDADALSATNPYLHTDSALPLAWDIDHLFPCAREGKTMPSNLRTVRRDYCSELARKPSSALYSSHHTVVILSQLALDSQASKRQAEYQMHMGHGLLADKFSYHTLSFPASTSRTLRERSMLHELVSFEYSEALNFQTI